MAKSTLTLSAPPDVFKARRAKFAAGMSRPILLAAGRARNRNPANDWAFRADSTYLYFGGPPIENAYLLIEPESDGDDGCSLFRPPSTPDDAVWFGEAVDDDTVAAATGLGRNRIVDDNRLDDAVSGREVARIAPQCPATLNRLAEMGLPQAGPAEILDIVDMRNIKDQHELARMRNAARVSMDAHRAVMRLATAGRREAEAAAALIGAMIAGECAPSFTPIITIHGEVLHCHGYPNTMAKRDLLLVDAGAEEPTGYACDITRTYPVDGQASGIQKALHDTVLRAQRAAVDACRPGKRYREIHDLAARVICDGLIDADLLKGNPDDLVARKAHTLFFTHGLGHLIGLDVHDLEDFGDLAGYAPGRSRRTDFGDKFLRLDRDLAPGMAVTIEPGIYIVPAVWRNDALVAPLADCINRAAVDALLKDGFGGIRLEDTVVVRDGEPENLTAELPMSIDDVAAFARS